MKTNFTNTTTETISTTKRVSKEFNSQIISANITCDHNNTVIRVENGEIVSAGAQTAEPYSPTPPQGAIARFRADSYNGELSISLDGSSDLVTDSTTVNDFINSLSPTI